MNTFKKAQNALIDAKMDELKECKRQLSEILIELSMLRGAIIAAGMIVPLWLGRRLDKLEAWKQEQP
jgi:hypothetical protein